VSVEAFLAVMLVTHLLISFLTAAVGAIIGGHFQGRPILGAVLGFLFRSIGWIMIFCFPDPRRRCAACRAVAGAQATDCGRCGRRLAREGPK
jgi:hypothetical protein